MNSSTRTVDAPTSAGDRDSTGPVGPRQPRDAGVPAQRLGRPRGISAAVLVADPGRESRYALAQGMQASGITQVLVADSAAQVNEIITSGQNGQLALVSLAFGSCAARLIDDLRRGSWSRVIALAPTADPDAVLAALAAGASGVLRGHPAPIVMERPPAAHKLTEREVEVLAGVAEGRSNQWIGEHLALSALTIKSHLARISRKLGTGDRAHMVAIAMRAGLIH